MGCASAWGPKAMVLPILTPYFCNIVCKHFVHTSVRLCYSLPSYAVIPWAATSKTNQLLLHGAPWHV